MGTSEGNYGRSMYSNSEYRHHQAESHTLPIVFLDRVCEGCNQHFLIKAKQHRDGTIVPINPDKRFCSRSCASLNSITPKRLEGNRKGGINVVHGANDAARLLRKREDWKYAPIIDLLKNIKFIFEYVIEDFVFDLALLDSKTLIEFDGPEHRQSDGSLILHDQLKNKIALAHGFSIIRMPVSPSSAIDRDLFKKYLSRV